MVSVTDNRATAATCRRVSASGTPLDASIEIGRTER